MKRNLLLLLSPIVMILVSCSKDHTNPDTAGIQGTYKLKSLSAKTNSTLTDNEGGKLITVSDYTTINNSGTIVIDGSRFSATGLSYEVNSMARASFYQDNQFVDSFSTPFNVKIPPINSTAPYKLIGADSIYFQNGSLASGIAGNGSIQTGPNGGRYTLSGNLLTIKQNASKDSSFQESGITYHKVDMVLATFVMEKQ
ncbi:MAG TPA: hypothetical protein VJ279_13325 [Hanamia sp.]|nr:hypothetical protein [Hanamia sp.]